MRDNQQEQDSFGRAQYGGPEDRSKVGAGHADVRAGDAKESDVKEDVAAFVSDVRASATEAVSAVQQEAQRKAQDQKDAGARRLKHVARAIERAADELDDGMPFAAKYIRQAAGQVDDLSHSLAGRTVEDLAQGIARLARERPTLVLGAGILAGFALTRFLKSSSSSPSARNADVAAGGEGRAQSTFHRERHDGPSLQPQGEPS